MPDTESKEYYGTDKFGNKYFYFEDKSPNDFWIGTVIKKEPNGNYVVLSCEIISPIKDEKYYNAS